MNQHEKSAAGAEARRALPRHAWRPDEPQRQDALMRYLGALATVSAEMTQRPAAQTPRPAPPAPFLVRDLMATSPPSVAPDTGLPGIARALSEHGTGSLPVVDTDGRVVGVVSEADLLAVVAARTHRTGAASRVREARPTAEPGGEKAETLMTSPAITVQPDTAVSEAAWLVALARLKRVPVAEPDGRLVGTVSRHTLLDALLRDDAAILEGVRGRIRQAFPGAADTVRVTVEDGVVRLCGEVAGDEAARLLVEVKGLEPVTDVIDELTVRDR
ncbi:CBS domain-containing protein [Streptomyces sp. NPDC058746]|uniref:CBS domain-containing protein n=1 Tax=Streptomyces sp. NPDC058746 TaxID=3346622 RepID=UPI0036B1A703